METTLRAALPSPDWGRAREGRIVVALASASAWWAWRADAFAGLDAHERARVARKVRAADRDVLTIAYALHRHLLAHWLRCAPASVGLSRDALGCPRLAGGAGWTSLSHADDAIAFAFSDGGPVGIDIEPLHRARGLRELDRLIAHPRELDVLPADCAARDAALLALWVRKEALLKAAGIGLAREMCEFEAPAGEPLPLPDAAGSATITMLECELPALAAVAGDGRAGIVSAWLHPPPGARPVA